MVGLVEVGLVRVRIREKRGREKEREILEISPNLISGHKIWVKKKKIDVVIQLAIDVT